jgi:hypothetical protein
MRLMNMATPFVYKKSRTFPGMVSVLSIMCVMCALCAAVFVSSCNQDSLFSDISNEPEPRDPRIPGTPTNIVTYGGSIYVTSVGSSSIHRYDNGWSKFDAGGSVIALAADTSGLYALIHSGDLMKATLKRYSGGWSTVDAGAAAGYSLQTIYCAGGSGYGGGSSGKNYGIFASSGGALRKVADTSSILTGAAGTFLSTGGSGIYSSSGSLVSDSKENVTGIMNVGGETVAVTRNGRILVSSGGGFSERMSTGLSFTGGMALWPSSTSPTLLLLGVQSSGSYSKGYREVALDASGKLTGNAVIPGTVSPSSITESNRSKYEASLAKYSVHYILPLSNGAMIFASTANSGLYSLRDGLWNAE